MVEDGEDKFKKNFFGLYPENPLNRCKISLPSPMPLPLLRIGVNLTHKKTVFTAG